MLPNFLFIALAALVPLIIGFIWYNPKVFGNAWMKSAGITAETMQGANMALIFVLTYVFSFILALILFTLVVHQTHLFSLFMDAAGNPPAEGTAEYDQFIGLMAQFEGKFRTVTHGLLHEAIIAIFVALPVLAINALFERKGFKYIAINAGYWILTLAIMGAIVCQFG